MVRLYGTGWGVLAALLAGSCAFAAWQHPFFLFVMAAEAIIFGMLMRRGMRNILLADGIFWLFFGLPFLWIFYGTVLHFDGGRVLQILLKHGFNGLGNAALATLAYHLLIASRWERRTPPLLWDTHFNLIVSAFLLPAVLLVLLNTVGVHDAIIPAQATQLTDQAGSVYAELERMAAGINNSLNEVSHLTSRSRMRPTEELRQRVETIRRKSPILKQLFVADTTGRMILSAGVLSRSASERSMIDTDFSALQEQQLPLVTEVRTTGGPDSHINWYIPLIDGGRFAGVVGGVIDVAPLRRLLEERTQSGALALTLIDRQGKIAASSDSERKPRTDFFRGQSAAKRLLDSRTFMWQPRDQQLSSIPLWTYFFSSTLPPDNSLPWGMAVEIPSERFLAHLQRVVGGTLAIMLAPALLAISILPLLLRRLTTPLNQLAEASSNLPEKIIRGEEISWPKGAAEISALADNYKTLVNALEPASGRSNPSRNPRKRLLTEC
jgi:hypothetical protein